MSNGFQTTTWDASVFVLRGGSAGLGKEREKGGFAGGTSAGSVRRSKRRRGRRVSGKSCGGEMRLVVRWWRRREGRGNESGLMVPGQQGEGVL